MKDNFDIRQYLTENKLTEATRENRKHFGKVTLNEHVVLEAEDLSPESILGNEKFVAKGEGFNVDEISQALKTGMEALYKNLSCARLNIHNRPAYPAVRQLEFTETGDGRYILSVEDVANSLEYELTSGCDPKELQSHILGWIITIWSFSTLNAYPLLDEEGVDIYKAAGRRLTRNISKDYTGHSYRGD